MFYNLDAFMNNRYDKSFQDSIFFTKYFWNLGFPKKLSYCLGILGFGLV